MRHVSAWITLLLLVGAGCAGTDDGGAADTTPASDATIADASADEGPTPVPPVEVAGCPGTTLLELPDDFAARGPWPVGARTVVVPGDDSEPDITVEVLYPAVPGSEAGAEPRVYDIRVHLPPDEQGLISDADNPWQACGCYGDLPLDTARGPYPVVVFIHGTAGYRTQSLAHNLHWASRGFVVLTADHPGMKLADILTLSFDNRMVAQADLVLAALEAGGGPLAFLDGHVDTARLAVSGHSAGGNAASSLAGRPGVQVVVPMAGAKATDSPLLASSLILGGLDDGVVAFSDLADAYGGSAPAKRLVGLSNAGHLAFSDICALGRDRGGVLAIASASGVEVPDFIAFLADDGCREGQLAPERGWVIANGASSAALEEVLHCSQAATAWLSGLGGRYPEVGDFREALE